MTDQEIEEWEQILLEAIEMGLSIEEIRSFLQSYSNSNNRQ